MLLYNARIIPVEGQTIENGFIEISNGKIAAVGTQNKLSSVDGDSFDLGGASVYPGFVDAHCHIGMWEDGLGFEGSDGNEDTEPSTPHLRGLDAVNPLDRCFAEALEAGVTSVVTGPGSSNPVAGQLFAMKTYGRCVDDMIIKEPVAIKFALGENPKLSFHAHNQAPVTRMATAAIIREQLYKAKRYLEDKQKASEDEDTDEPEYDMRCEALIPLLGREISAHFHAHRADDIFTAMRIAKEFDLDYTIIHCTEGYLIADELKKAGAKAIVGPLICDRSKPELKNADSSNPGRMDDAGIIIAICTDHPVVPVQYLTTSAAVAVREGMDYESALRAITITAAKLGGIDHRVGSIAVGKDADLVIFDGDPLSILSKPKMVLVGGEIVKKPE